MKGLASRHHVNKAGEGRELQPRCACEMHHPMNTLIVQRVQYTLVLCLLVAISLHGQDFGNTGDTSQSRVRLLDPGISSGKSLFYLPPSLRIIPVDLMDSHGPLYETPLPYLRSPVSGKIDLIAPFKLQLERQKDLQTVRTILGTAQLGGALYLGYQQLRKREKK
jgi:hypothetical protein